MDICRNCGQEFNANIPGTKGECPKDFYHYETLE